MPEQNLDLHRPVETLSAAERFGSFAAVLWETIRGGGVLVPEDVLDRRMVICQSCEFFDGTHNRCLVCRCNVRPQFAGFLMDLANKLAHPASECPQKKWGKYDPGNA